MANKDEKLSSKKYVLVFISLLFLTALTVTLSHLKHALALTITIPLMIAAFQGVLIGRYSMGLINGKPVIFWLLLLVFIFLVVILLLPVWEQFNGVGSKVLPFR